MLLLIIGICGFFAVALITIAVSPHFLGAANQYRDEFKSHAHITLGEMFIFIDPEKLFIINIMILIVSFILTWFITDVWLIALIVSLVLAYSPRFLYNYLRRRRQKKFLFEFPDALHSLASMMQSGANLNMALETLISETSGAISEEFGLFMRELRLGINFDDALDNLYERMPVPEMRLVVSGMKISREIGGSLAEVLARMSETIRRKIEMEGKIDSLTAQGRAQGWVMGLLPLLLGYVISKIEPVAMARLFTDPIGWGVCVFFIVFMAIGIYFIRKIVNIDV
tara:strand:+ start:8774 stop:9622 length:849 start_codon:yes stop_codon:yes gene_type:complete